MTAWALEDRPLARIAEAVDPLWVQVRGKVSAPADHHDLRVTGSGAAPQPPGQVDDGASADIENVTHGRTRERCAGEAVPAT